MCLGRQQALTNGLCDAFGVQVVTDVVQARGTGTSRQDAHDLIARLAEAAPEWLTLVEAAEGRPRLARINPGLSGASVRAKLVAAAKEARRASLLSQPSLASSTSGSAGAVAGGAG